MEKKRSKYATLAEVREALQTHRQLSEQIDDAKWRLLPEETKKAIDAWWSRREPLLMEDVKALLPPKPFNLIACLALGLAFGALLVCWTIAARLDKISAAPKPSAAAVVVSPAAPVAPPIETVAVPDAEAHVTVDRPCWVGDDRAGRVVRPGEYALFRLPATVRSGCPGKIHYAVDGKEVRPANLSGAPERSEVVRLP